MTIGFVTSTGYANIQTAFEGGLGGPLGTPPYEAVGKYDDGGGLGASHKELYTAVTTFDNDVNVNVIVAAGGVVSAHAAWKNTHQTPFLVLAGETPPDFSLSTNPYFRGGVNLQTPGQNASRHDYLASYYGVHPDKVCLLWNSNSKMGKRERKTWVKDDGWPLDEMVTANDENTFAGHFANAKNSGALAVVVSADPFFFYKKDKLVQAANNSLLYVCYPFSLYTAAATPPASGRSMWFGPDLDAAYTLLGQKTAAVRATPGTNVGFDSVSPGGPHYL
jgi:hypothetical protein